MAYNHIEPGREITITDHVYFQRGQDNLAELVKLPPGTVEEMKQSSIVQEQEIYDKLCASTAEWAEQAGNTLLLMKAMEYLKTPVATHTSNRWTENDYGQHEISNMVYSMSWRVYEDTKWNKAAGKSIPVAWQLSWSVHFNTPQNPDDSSQGRQLAGQDRKRFTDKAGMEKYLQGRIETYAHLFTERSPPVPEEHRGRFCINGQLLQGYTIETPEPLEPDKAAVDALLSCLDDMDIGGNLESPPETQTPVPAARETVPSKQKKPHAKQTPTR